MTEEQFRKKWLRQHSQYEKIAYKEFLGAFRDTADSIPFNMLTPSNYEMVYRVVYLKRIYKTHIL